VEKYNFVVAIISDKWLNGFRPLRSGEEMREYLPEMFGAAILIALVVITAIDPDPLWTALSGLLR
jgi:hypothetical protein